MICCGDNTTSREYFHKIYRSVAKQRPDLLPKLKQRLQYLRTYANGPGCTYEGGHTRCVLYPDFAPLSFAFVMQKRQSAHTPWEYWFNGGLIYHGNPVPICGAEPNFTVRIGGENDDWGVHT